MRVFADDRAETVVLEEHGVALHGLSYPRREVRDSLVPLYPAAVAGALNIGVMHTNAGGSKAHENYAPCSIDELVRKGYDYWALGHVHTHEVLHTAPWVVFPGNTQGRHIRETGPKGAVVVSVERGAVTGVRHAPLDVVRWREVTVALDADDGVDELYDKAREAFGRARDEAEGRLLAARLVVEGATRAHADVAAGRDRVIGELRARALDLGDALWLEKVELRTRPAVALDELRGSEGFVGELLRAVDEARRDPALAAELRAQLQPLVEKLGDELPGRRRRRGAARRGGGAPGVRARRAVKISELRLERFGHFADVTVPLDRGGPGGLTVLHGANEAGKSTLLAALRAFLFGFPRKGAWDFRWPSETLAIGGTVAFADGAIAELRREKKRGLRGQLGDLALTDDLLRARLGKPSEEMFSTVFAFSLEDLARGGEALRDEGLRAAIAGAGLGAARSPQAVIKELRDQAESLFTVKGRSGKLINSTLADIKERELERRKVEARGEDYEARVRARDAARAEAEALGRRRRSLLVQVGEREALARALPRRDELRGAHAERAALPATTLPPDAGEAYERVRAERERLRVEAREGAAKLARVQQQAEKLELDDELLRAAPRIRPLHEGLGRHAEESRQAEELAATHRTRRVELGRQLDGLRRGWALDDLDVAAASAVHERPRAAARRLVGASAARARARAARRGAARARRQARGAAAAARSALAAPLVRRRRARLSAGAARRGAQAPSRPRRGERARRRRAAARGRQAARGAARAREPALAARRRWRGAVGRGAGAAARGARRGLVGVQGGAEQGRAGGARRGVRDGVARRRRPRRRAAPPLRRRGRARAADAALRRHRARARPTARWRWNGRRAERLTADAAWRELWARCGFVPQSPETMLDWLGDYAELRKLDGELGRIDEQAATLRAAQDDYERRIGAILETLAFDPRTELGQARRIVDTVLAVRMELEALRRDEERARKLAASVAAWRNDVKRLCADHAPPLAALAATDASAAMRALAARLAAAQEAERLRAQLESQAEELAAEHTESARAEREAAATLEAWRVRAGVDDDVAFLQLAAAARRRHALDAEVAALERALAEARGAVAAEVFAAALEAAERGVLGSELADARAELERVDADLRAASERVGAAEEALKQLDGGARAAELGAGVESRRAALRGLVEQYAVVTLSRALLERQVARFQERHQPRMIEELSSLFRALTEGRYTRVYPRYDDEGTFVAVRKDGVEVAPAAMSTGTREQLWLAVRLAYVRQYCDASEPLPLILDDPLVNFDAAPRARHARRARRLRHAHAGPDADLPRAPRHAGPRGRRSRAAAGSTSELRVAASYWMVTVRSPTTAPLARVNVCDESRCENNRCITLAAAGLVHAATPVLQPSPATVSSTIAYHLLVNPVVGMVTAGFCS